MSSAPQAPAMLRDVAARIREMKEIAGFPPPNWRA